MEEKGSSRRKIETELIKNAMQDAAFRERLVKDPKGTLTNEIGIKIPDEIEVKVVEETPEIIYIVLPSQVEGFTSGKSTEASAAMWDHAQMTSCNTQDLCNTSGRPKR